MRLFAAAALVAALASASVAQTQFSDGSGVYVGLNSLSGSGLAGSAGHRFSSGLDVGLLVDVYQSTQSGQAPETQASFSVGPQVGYTTELRPGVLGRVSGHVIYRSDGATANRGPRDSDYQTVSGQGLSERLTATVSRPTRLAGSLRVHPTAGVFASAFQTLSYTNSEDLGLVSRSRAGAGVYLGLPVSFRLLKQDLAVDPYVLVPGIGTTQSRTLAGASLRANF